MKVIDIYRKYFKASAVFGEIERRAALVCLTVTSECGNVKYEISVNFFPHREEEDFGITYDAYVSKEIYSAQGRRSKKREEQFLAKLQEVADELAKELGGTIFWEEALGV